MLVDAGGIEKGAVLEADVAVVGGGAAGIALARELGAGGRSVLLVESGGLEYEEEAQLLYAGEARGTVLGERSFYLTASRLRYFGGSTNHWNGWCRPLDAEDFAEHPWREESGWPIALEDLAPYYDRAAPVLGISPFDYDPAEAGVYPHLLRRDPAFETVFFHLSAPLRFGQAYRAELEAAEAVRVLLHANVVALRADEEAARVLRLECARLDGTRFDVRARAYVLAAGGLENARLLLVSDDVQSAGLGNGRDLVGRHFMDHPSVALGEIALPYWRKMMSTYQEGLVRQRGHAVRGVLKIASDLQESERLLNSLLVLEPLRPAELPELAAEVAWLATDHAQLVKESPDPEAGSFYFGSLQMSSEQLPHAESRVTLGEERDALGVRRLVLDWRLADEDRDSILRTALWLVRRLGARSLGRVRLTVDEETLWRSTRWSNHHMGTTRMAAGPDRGVVDADCRVHGVANLWVAGSSVFPTCGSSNPTFTIVALALRLAERLAAALDGGRA